jgi:hypothetical protein
MAATPEATVKKVVRKILKEVGAYSFWPVQMGMGARTVDVLVCYRSKFFGFEIKAPGEKPTALQSLCMRKIMEAGGETLVIDSVEMAGHLEHWLEIHTATEVLE